MDSENSVVLIPGWGTGVSAWKHVVPQLSQRRDVMTIDWPWCNAGGDQSMQDFEEYTSKVARRLPDSSELVGWSLGGLLSLKIAISNPQKVAKLVLVGSAPCMVSRHDWPCGIDASNYCDFVERFSVDPTRTWKRFLALVTAGDKHPSETRAELIGGCPYNELAEHEYRYGLEWMERLDLRPQLGAIDCPIALIHGANDQLIPCRTSMETQKIMPHASLHVIEDAGHAPQIAQPAQFGEALSISLKL